MTHDQLLSRYKTRSAICGLYFRCAKYLSQFENGKTERSKRAREWLFSISVLRKHRGDIAKMILNFTIADGSSPYPPYPPGLYLLFPIGYDYERISLPAGSPEELELKLSAMGF